LPNSARLLRALTASVETMFGPDIAYASEQEAILATLRMVESREVHGAALFTGWSSRLEAQLKTLTSELNLAATAPDLSADMIALQEALHTCRPVDTPARDRAERDILGSWARLAGRIAADPRLPEHARAQIVSDIAAAERQRAVELMGALLPNSSEHDTDLTPGRLRAYLADRFNEPLLLLTSFRPLPGGYGKETTLFETSSNTLNGAFVMRRDRAQPTLDNDCHRIEREYPVIRAAYERGFPAPEALWLDTEHTLLPGGNFLVMRRAAGTSGGDVFRAAGTVTTQLVELLATKVAELHALPPMRELANISEGLSPELWDLSPKQVTERYIRSIRDLYLAEMVVPSPAVLAFYGWLLANVPDSPGRPVLLHGDIGFHNFIIDDGRLTAVVDWEFSHIGDPAEDVGYVRNTSGDSIDWAVFMNAYRAAGGADIDPDRLHFFQIWGHLRNLTASQITSSCFERGKLNELKLGHVGHSMMPGFLDAISSVIAAGRLAK
jgi:aminoglycoside phosphotransferase (APT) family kinase protein